MKKIDRVRLAIQELGETWTRAAVRAKIEVSDLSDAQLDKALQNIKKESSTIFINSTNISGNGRCSISSLILSILFSMGLSILHVPRSFRDAAIERYGDTWGRILSYIVTSHDPQSDSDAVILPQSILALSHPYGFGALLTGKKPNLNLAGEIWKEYRDDKAPFYLLIEDYVPNTFCRSVVDYTFDASLLDHLLGEDLVEVFTGMPLDAGTRSNVSDTPEIEEARLRLNSQHIDYSQYLLNKEGFNAILKDYPLEVRIHQSAILNKVLHKPTPTYSAGHKTSRLYTSGASFQNLLTELRERVFAGQSQFDLAHAQLSILRVLWDIPMLSEYMKSNLWERLKAETGVSNKPALKILVYRIAYGSKFTQCLYDLQRDAGLTREEALQAMRAPLVKALFDAQDRQFAKVKKSKTVIDAFGRELLEPRKVNENGKEEAVKDREIRSALAVQAQSYELKVLLPVLDFLASRSVPILVWLHDGFICPTNTVDYYPALNALVEQEAKRLGMTLRLSHEFIGVK